MLCCYAHCMQLKAHRLTRPYRGGNDVPIYNVTERLAREMLGEHEVKATLSCGCHQCQDDVLAMALNQLPARYVSTDQGGVFVKANYLNPQLQSDILGELIRAGLQVSEHPHHPSGQPIATNVAPEIDD